MAYSTGGRGVIENINTLLELLILNLLKGLIQCELLSPKKVRVAKKNGSRAMATQQVLEQKQTKKD